MDLSDRSRRPVRYAHQIESLIVSLKRDKPHWGARKIRELLVRRLAGEVRVPAKSTIHAVLDRHGLVKRIGRTRRRASGTPLSPGATPNDLWCADFKGEFKLGNGRYCDPLTVTDHASRFPLLCEALDSTCEDLAVTAFERTRPAAGHPLRQRRALCQPQRLVQPVKALSLVAPARHRHRAHQARPSATKWRHEPTHLTLKKEATRPPGMNSLQQQARFDAFVHEFNAERPHEALANEVSRRNLFGLNPSL
jgi:transposase InsO family protein